MHSFQSKIIECLLGARRSVEPESPRLSALSLKNIIGARSRVRTLDWFLRLGKPPLCTAPWWWQSCASGLLTLWGQQRHSEPLFMSSHRALKNTDHLISILSFYLITGPYYVPPMWQPLWDGYTNVVEPLVLFLKEFIPYSLLKDLRDLKRD